MKHQVNLYVPKLHPKLRLLTFSLVLFLWCFVLGFVLLLNFYFASEQQTLQKEFGQLNSHNNQQRALVNSLQAELENLKADPQLMSQVAKKQQMVSLKKRVHNELVGQEKRKTTGFANLMLDLAENHQTDLWLTRLYLNDQSVTIEGATSKSASIPVWVNKLGNSQFLKGQQFSETRIYRDEDQQQLHFVLTTGENKSSTQAGTYE
jgi:Tfp pilus assembly protein PilN